MKKLFSVLTVLFLLVVSTNSAFAALKDGYSLVYRLYNPKTGEHLYTGDGHENDVLGSQGWNKEGAVCLFHTNQVLKLQYIV